MERKPARLERAGALTPRDRIWALVRALGANQAPRTPCAFSIAEVAALSGVSCDIVYDYFLGLSKAQPPFLELVDRARPVSCPRRDVFLWRLVRDVGVDAPRVTEAGKVHTAGQGNQQVWDTMRRLRSFDLVELAAAASTQECPVSEAAAKNLLVPLVSAGYVAKVRESKSGIRGNPDSGLQARYAFVRAKNTGPRAPSLLKGRALYDNNLGAIVWAPAGRAAAASLSQEAEEIFEKGDRALERLKVLIHKGNPKK